MDGNVAFAHRLADVAGEIAGRRFTGRAMRFDIKPDGSPVTDVDVEVETALKAVVAAERPNDGFLGEEVGASGPRSRRWIVDGIDGTENFVRGRPDWGTQIALEVDDQIVVGVSFAPALGRRWWARRGDGAWVAPMGNGAAGAMSRLQVSDQNVLSEAECSFVPPLQTLSGDEHGLASRLADVCRSVAPTGSFALMVAAGEVDVSLQLRGGPWDFAGLAVIVEEAGGRFSDVKGAWQLYEGGPVIFSNARLHDAVLDIIVR